jgi:tripartite-type tricarboxylate transporter receptor subunit TctC
MKVHWVLIAAWLLPTAVPAQESYPVKPMRLIVPYPPGGTSDIVGRDLAQKMGELLGQQVIVDNRPGAGSLIGLTHGARSPADGYTMTFGTSAGLAVNPALGTKMQFDPHRDFTLVGMIAYSPFFLVVNPSLPARTVKEFIALAKARPGEINFASPGVGTPNHLGIELLTLLTGARFVHVPYKGGAPAIVDLISGQVQAFFSSRPQIVVFLKEGRLRIIAAATPKPTRVGQGLPVIADTLPGFDCNTWYGLLVPTGTPAAIVTRLGTELNRALSDPEVARRLLDQGIEAMPGTQAAFREFVMAGTDRWRKVIKSAGVKIESAR